MFVVNSQVYQNFAILLHKMLDALAWQGYEQSALKLCQLCQACIGKTVNDCHK